MPQKCDKCGTESDSSYLYRCQGSCYCKSARYCKTCLQFCQCCMKWHCHLCDWKDKVCQDHDAGNPDCGLTGGCFDCFYNIECPECGKSSCRCVQICKGDKQCIRAINVGCEDCRYSTCVLCNKASCHQHQIEYKDKIVCKKCTKKLVNLYMDTT